MGSPDSLKTPLLQPGSDRHESDLEETIRQIDQRLSLHKDNKSGYYTYIIDALLECRSELGKQLDNIKTDK